MSELVIPVDEFEALAEKARAGDRECRRLQAELRVALGELEALEVELGRADKALEAALQYVTPKDRAWIEGIRR